MGRTSPITLNPAGKTEGRSFLSIAQFNLLLFHLSQLVSGLCKDEDLDNPGQTDGTIIYAAYYYINSTVVKNRSSLWLY